jgi:hypothetical protein
MSKRKATHILNLATQYVSKYNKSTVIHKYTRSKKMTKTASLLTLCTLQLEEQKPKEDKFKVAVIEATDEVFSSLSNLDKEEVYFYLENAFKINKQEIPFRMKDFADAIEQIFGIGAKLIEIRIIEALHKRITNFMFTPKKGFVSLKEYATSLRSFLLQP